MARPEVITIRPMDKLGTEVKPQLSNPESKEQFSNDESQQQSSDYQMKQQSLIDDNPDRSMEAGPDEKGERKNAEPEKKENEDSLETSESIEDMDGTWASICEMVIKERPSIGTLKQRAKIISISQNTITIEAENEITAKRLEDGMQIISEAATVVLGRPIRGQIAIQGKDNKSANAEDDETIQKLKELLGDIPIQMQ